MRLSSDRVHASRPRCRNGQDTRGVYAVGLSNQAATKLQAGPSHAAYGRRAVAQAYGVRCAGVWGVGSVYVRRARTQSAHDLVLDKITLELVYKYFFHFFLRLDFLDHFSIQGKFLDISFLFLQFLDQTIH